MVLVCFQLSTGSKAALLHYTDGIKAYILAPKGLKVGDVVESGDSVDIKPGNALELP